MGEVALPENDLVRGSFFSHKLIAVQIQTHEAVGSKVGDHALIITAG